MEIYRVGGAVRDRLLGQTVTERDWVVVGSTPDEMLRLGYRPVGKDFPVFLHPESHEEYALARTERKVGPGYTGFSVNASPDVTLREDLSRRDLTINAIAIDSEGRLIDPFGGREDIEKRRLRHVSSAFTEDPLRVLRAARFAARLAPLGFTVATETMQLMREMADGTELSALRPERVWQETHKALETPRPEVFFRVLRECGALQHVYEEVDALFGVPQPARWHPEIDTGVHTLMALAQAADLSQSTEVRFAVLVHDLGKATTPKHVLPSHHGHGERSVERLDRLGERLPIPRRHRELAVLVARHHGLVHRAFELKPGTVFKLLESTDAIRQPGRFDAFLTACEADARGRKGLEDRAYPQADGLRDALAAAREVDASPLREGGLEGVDLGRAIRERRLEAVRAALARCAAAP